MKKHILILLVMSLFLFVACESEEAKTERLAKHEVAKDLAFTQGQNCRRADTLKDCLDACSSAYVTDGFTNDPDTDYRRSCRSGALAEPREEDVTD